MSLHFWIVCLLLSTSLTIGITQKGGKGKTTTTTTTTTPSTEKNDEIDKINLMIQYTLETSRTGYFIGNMEFEHYTSILQHALSLNPYSLYLKKQAYYKFMSYNCLRLKLEADLESRIAVIESYFHGKTTEDCKKFYENQKKELRSAFNEHNTLKLYKLKLYSERCTQEDSDDSEESEDDDGFWWKFLPSWLES